MNHYFEWKKEIGGTSGTKRKNICKICKKEIQVLTKRSVCKNCKKIRRAERKKRKDKI